MTVSATPLSATYDCNGIMVDFPFTFGVKQTSDLRVVLIDANDAETELTEITHYTVTGTPIAWDGGGNPTAWQYEDGGTVSTVATYGSGNHIRICTDIPITQTTEFYKGMGNLQQAVEDAVDKITRLLLQLEARIVVLEAFMAGGIPAEGGDITYLGILVNDPDTSGWGANQAFVVWYNSTDKHAKYWNGEEIVLI